MTNETALRRAYPMIDGMGMEERNLSRIPHECALRIQAVYYDLKTAERKAVDYMLEVPDQIPGLSIIEYAYRAGCSEATIVRLSKRLGYEGYPQLKHAFERADANGDNDVGYHEIAKTDGPTTVLRKVFESATSALEDTLRLLDAEQYTATVDAIVRSDQMLVSGLGDAGVVATETGYRFSRLGKSCNTPTDPDLQLIYASRLSEGDVFIGISHSGRSAPIVDTAEVALENGATVVAITNFPNSPLAKIAHYVLQTAVFTRTSTGEIMAKRIAQLSIVESLYVNYLMHDQDATRNELLRSDLVVRRNKLGGRGDPHT